MRVGGSGEGARKADGNEPVCAANRIQLREYAALELVGGSQATRGLARGGRAHGAHGEERKRADSHQSEEPTSHLLAIGRSTSTPHHQIEEFSYAKAVDARR